ncbi:hypothetical protein [Cellulomonas sp.]|uniref:hypothetical protein n=1 Tax=Cellulomonas sp. TaxID=40001 RepID=UPI003BAA31D0
MAPTRIARPYWFRAAGVSVPWPTVFRGQVAALVGSAGGIGAAGRSASHVVGGGTTVQLSEPALQAASAAARRVGELKERATDIQLRWGCKAELGVPFGPFTVWVRKGRTPTTKVTVQTRQRSDGLVLRLPVVAATVVVDAQAIDPTRPVGIIATYRGGGLREAVGADARVAAGGGRAWLRVSTSGANRILLVNGTDPQVQVAPLQDVLDDPEWTELERVGVPVPDPWAGTAYDTREHGMRSAPTDPVTASRERLERGGPPLGWAPITQAGNVVTPPWRAPDYDTLLKEIGVDLVPRIERLYRPTLTPADQAALVDQPPVDPPSRADGTQADIATKAALQPLALLQLPAAADPFLALALGFGTAYPGGQFPRGEGLEFLVTADYPDTPFGDGPVTLAAYVPEPGDHVATTTPHDVVAFRSGLLSPPERDEAWRESVRVQWDRVPSTAAIGSPTSGVFARYTGAGDAELLVEERLAGDRRPLVLVPDGVAPDPASSRTSMVDADVVIPLGSGGRHVHYPVTVQDVFGVWSPWVDEPWDGTEPKPPGPRIVSAKLTSTYTGSTTCPAVLQIELAVEWKDRTPTSVELASVFFRTPTADAPVPGGVDPVAAAPSGMFRRDVSLPFVGERLTGPGDVTIVHLDEKGELAVPPGSDQGTHGRRYRVSLPVSLDFGSTPRWAARLWLRTPLAVVPDAGFLPDDVHPAVVVAASPVPIPPILPPPPPGVPMGSTPDASGRSHVRVSWSVAGGAPLDSTKGCVVWEVSETALRQAGLLSNRAPDGTAPGVRLAELWAAYDGLTATKRRSVFRRILDLPGAAREADVALPAGSTDIHLFTVTTLSATGTASDWPSDPTPHLVLQAATPPRLRRPGPPRVRSAVQPGGTVALSLSADSDVPVAAFRLFRTRSAEAALRAETMGPAFAVVPAVPPGSGAPVDPASGLALYTAAWIGAFDPSWDDWHVRAVAVPVDTVPVLAVRGLPSEASDVVTVRVRPITPPDLAPLVAAEWGGGFDGVLVTTSTSSPVRELPDGEFRVSATVSAAVPGGAAAVDPVALRAVVAGPVTLGDGAPPPASTQVVLRSGVRAARRTPLALWFTRPVATDPVEVDVTLTDPQGRLSVQTVTVPGHVVAPPPTLEITGVITITGRGVVVSFASDAPLVPTSILTIQVTAGRGGPLLGGGTRGGLRVPLGRPDRLDIALPDVPTIAKPSTVPIQVVRSGRGTYDAMIRIPTPFTVRLTVATADGQSQVSRKVT